MSKDQKQPHIEDPMEQPPVSGEEMEQAKKETLEEQSHGPQEQDRPTEEQQGGNVQEKVEELKDKYLRLFAEFENYKKRTIREKLEMMKTAAQDTMSALLPVLDDFDRAKKAADDPNTEEQFSEGVAAVYHKLYLALEKKGLKAMESTGQPFDPEKHEAVTEIPAPSEELKGKVVDTIEKGYWLNDRIIRHAKVVVGK